MNRGTINILIIGVGGQGVLLASEIAAVTFAMAGYDVKMSAAGGISQRGGTVYSHIRIGEKIYSPLIPAGKADILVAMELSEISGWLRYLKKQCLVILLNKQILSRKITSGLYKYIDNLKDEVRIRCKRVLEITYNEIDRDFKNRKTANIFMLGALSNYFSVRKEYWLKAIKEKVSFQMRDLNLASFDLGRRKFRDNSVFKDVRRKMKR